MARRNEPIRAPYVVAAALAASVAAADGAEEAPGPSVSAAYASAAGRIIGAELVDGSLRAPAAPRRIGRG